MWRNGHLITVVNGDRTIEFAVEAITDLSEAADPAREFPSSQARCTVRLPDGTSAQWLLHRIKFGDSAPPYTWMDEATTTPITREDIAVMLRPLFI